MRIKEKNGSLTRKINTKRKCLKRTKKFHDSNSKKRENEKGKLKCNFLECFVNEKKHNLPTHKNRINNEKKFFLSPIQKSNKSIFNKEKCGKLFSPKKKNRKLIGKELKIENQRN